MALADARAKIASRQVRERDPNWEATPQVTDPNSIEGAISAREATAAEAEARLAELLRGGVPGMNPDWGVRRFENELRNRGFQYIEPTDSPGKLFRNGVGAEVRIMERPTDRWPNNPPQKLLNDYYYRYRDSRNFGYGPHITIPNK